MTVLSLGYVGIAATDLSAWHDFMGLIDAEIVERTELMVAATVDEWSRRLLVSSADRDDVDFVGWEVDGPRALARLIPKLTAATELTPEELASRDVEGGVWSIDPTGVRFELFFGAASSSRSEPLRTRFVTGPLGLGHVVLATGDLDASVRFYVDVLGFRITDTCMLDGTEIVFLRCNARHHSLALAGTTSSRHLMHAMIEVEGFDAVGRAWDRCAASGYAKTVIGRHSNDLMLSFYARTPSAFSLEYGAEGRIIDEHVHVPSTYHAESAWGHHPYSKEQT